MSPFTPISEDEIPGEGRPVPVGGAGVDGQREKLEAWARGRNAGMSNAAVALAVQGLLADRAAQAEEIERLRSSLKFQTVKADEAERQRAVIIREMPILLRTWCKARFKKWITWQTATNFRAEVLQTALSADTGSGEG